MSHLCHPPELRFLTFHQIHITRLWVLFSFGLVVHLLGHQNVLYCLQIHSSSLNWNTILFTVEEKCNGWLVFKLLHVCLVLVYVQKKTKVSLHFLFALKHGPTLAHAFSIDDVAFLWEVILDVLGWGGGICEKYIKYAPPIQKNYI